MAKKNESQILIKISFFLIFLFSLLFFWSINHALAIDTCNEGWQVAASGGQKTIDCHGVCKVVTNNCSQAIFVPTNTSAEWAEFRTNKPACVSLGDCITLPPPPATVSCQTISSSQIDVSWSPVSGATYYEVYFCIGSTCTPTTYLGQTSATSYSHTDLSSNTTYRYRVRACNTAGCSGYSSSIATCTTYGAAPSGSLSCYSSTQTSITLSYSFSNSASGQVSLFRSSTRLTTFSGTSGSGNYIDNGLSSETSYTYYLRDGTSATSPLLASRTCSTTSSPPPPSYTLSVQSTPITGFPITSTTGHDGTTDYTKSVTAGTSVSLTAKETYNYCRFFTWANCVLSTDLTINFTMPSYDTTCVAYYDCYNLWVLSIPKGIYISSDTGHAGRTNYSYRVLPGTSVSLNALKTSDPAGYSFSRWENCVSSTNRKIDFTMINSDAICMASYILTPCTGAYYTTGWGQGGPGCSGYNQRCYEGVCRTCENGWTTYFASDGCADCAGQGGMACWRSILSGVNNCNEVCDDYGGCVQSNWNDTALPWGSHHTCPVANWFLWPLKNSEEFLCYPNSDDQFFPAIPYGTGVKVGYRRDPNIYQSCSARDPLGAFQRYCVCQY